MSADPTQPSDPETTLPPPAADFADESVDLFRSKRRFKKGESETDEGVSSERAIQLLSGLLLELATKKEQVSQTNAVGTEAKASKYFRLSKTGSGALVALAESLAPEASVPAPAVSEEVNPDLPPATTTNPMPATPRRAALGYQPLQPVVRRRRWPFLSLLGTLALAGAAFYAGTRYTPPTKSFETKYKPPPAPVAWTDEMIARLDQALDADQSGDLKEAQRLASSLEKPGKPLPTGLDVYLASLTARQDQAYEAETSLVHRGQPASPEAEARVNEALAFCHARMREFERANDFHQDRQS